MSYTIFVDESGNTGAARDSSQPVFALGALWASAAQVLAIEDLMGGLRKTFRIQQPELKGAQLLRRTTGRQFLESMLRSFNDLRMPVSVVLVQKAFLAAAIFVDDATDYFYNRRFDESWTWPSDAKRVLADRILAYTPELLLQDFQETRRGTDARLFRQAAQRLAGAVRVALARDDLAPVADRLSHTDWEEVWTDANAPAVPIRHSPNLAALRIFLNNGDSQARDLGARNCSLVHDEQHEFAGQFGFLCKALSRASPMQRGDVHFPTDRISRLQFRSSADQPLLQAADCLTAVARSVVEERSEIQRPLVDALQELLRVQAGPEFPYALGSTEWCVRALTTLIPSALTGSAMPISF